LRGSQAGPAPRDTGFWGELAYRFERALRFREGELRAERGRLEQFLSAIEASPNGVMLLDANDQIEWCNSVAADHFDLDPVRDRLQRVTNLVRSPAFVAYIQGGKYDEPVTFLGPLGRRTFTVLVRTYGDGMKLVLTQDVTERERAEAMRRDFVANVSHEIRTPLTVLAGFVETMATLPLSEAERARVLTLMTQQTDRMQALVSDLLTLAQLEGSPRPGAERWVSVAWLMQRAEADAVALSGGRHKISSAGGSDVEIAGSDTELLSALGNLVNNAVRYTPAGGSVEIKWQRREDGGGDLEVIDTGIGVAREHLPRLTERFYRVDGSRSRETGGTGLGLSIVKHVVQRHGGEIELQSEVGRGTRIRLAFPAVRVRQRPALPEASARSAAST
jgi:two-component system phosphate regulon sensor histidine kinase PhoR